MYRMIKNFVTETKVQTTTLSLKRSGGPSIARYKGIIQCAGYILCNKQITLVSPLICFVENTNIEKFVNFLFVLLIGTFVIELQSRFRELISKGSMLSTMKGDIYRKNRAEILGSFDRWSKLFLESIDLTTGQTRDGDEETTRSVADGARNSRLKVDELVGAENYDPLGKSLPYI